MDCLFCNIIAKKIPSTFLYDTPDFIAIEDIHPQAPTHLLIITKNHYGEFLDIPETLVSGLVRLTKQIITEQKIREYRLVNNGQGAAVIDHFHLHVLGKITKERNL